MKILTRMAPQPLLHNSDVPQSSENQEYFHKSFDGNTQSDINSFCNSLAWNDMKLFIVLEWNSYFVTEILILLSVIKYGTAPGSWGVMHSIYYIRTMFFKKFLNLISKTLLTPRTKEKCLLSMRQRPTRFQKKPPLSPEQTLRSPLLLWNLWGPVGVRNLGSGPGTKPSLPRQGSLQETSSRQPAL